MGTKFTVTIEMGKDSLQMSHYANMAIAAAFLRSAGQTLGFIVDRSATVGKWEVSEEGAERPDLPALKRANLLLHDMWGMLEAETRASRPQGFGNIERKFREHLQAPEPVWPANPPARYTHDCKECVYLGQWHEEGSASSGELGPYDLYFCTQGGSLPTVIARYGSEAAEYTSGMHTRHPALQEAQVRAIACDLMTPDGKPIITPGPEANPKTAAIADALATRGTMRQTAHGWTPEAPVSTPRVEWRDDDGAELGWCVVDGGKVYPFGHDDHGKELATNEAEKWEPKRFGGRPDPLF